MALDLVAEFYALVDAFERERVPYAVCGGLALGFHGFARATMDIDLLVPRDALDDAMRVARQAGFDIPARKMIFGLREGKQREVQRLSKLDPDTNDLMRLDLLVAGEELEDVWAGRSPYEVAGHRITVVSREGLAIMKRIAGRPQDLLDLAKLEGKSEDDGTQDE